MNSPDLPPPSSKPLRGLREFFSRWNADKEESAKQRKAEAKAEVETESAAPQSESATWQPPKNFPPAPGPEDVLPSLPNRRLKIECLPSEPADSLPERVKSMCDEHGADGLQLSSTFSHDGSVFLVFKR